MTEPDRIRTLSRWLRIGATAAMVLLPCAAVWAVGTSMANPENLASAFPVLPPATSLTQTKALFVGLVGSLPLLPTLYGLLQMRNLFGRYISGEVLSEVCAVHIRRIGSVFVTLACLGILVPTVQLLILTFDSARGERLLSIAISSESIGLLLAGGLITVVGWAMSGAARAADENAGFV